MFKSQFYEKLIATIFIPPPPPLSNLKVSIQHSCLLCQIEQVIEILITSQPEIVFHASTCYTKIPLQSSDQLAILKTIYVQYMQENKKSSDKRTQSYPAIHV